ncbi:MAG TPA: RING-H2 finger protein [candidate division Zixibacteria bacterium]|nr:RING-H2 finger protein [candidate division Zixibacteria bacterium]
MYVGAYKINRGKSKVICLLIIGSLGLFIILPFFSPFVKSYSIKQENTLNISDFSRFKEHSGYDAIISENKNTSAFFALNASYFSGLYGSLFASSDYVLVFNELGSCSNFTISLTLNYHYSSEFGEFVFSVGSYEDYYTRIAYCKIVDTNEFSAGYFSIGAAHSDGSSNRNNGGLLNSDQLTLTLSRIGNDISCLIYRGGSPIITQTWGQLYGTPINYFRIGLNYNGPLDEFVFNSTSISGILSLDGIPVYNDPFGLYPNVNSSRPLDYQFLFLGLGMGLILAIVVLLIFKFKRKKPVIIREDPALYQHREPLSEDFLESVVTGNEMVEFIEATKTSNLDTIVSPSILSDKKEKHKCAICKIEIKVGSEVFKCPFCGSFFHKEHYIQWVSTKGKCPVCGKSLMNK